MGVCCKRVSSFITDATDAITRNKGVCLEPPSVPKRNNKMPTQENPRACAVVVLFLVGVVFFVCPKHIHTLAPDVHGILRGSPQNATASARARGRSGGASAAVAPAAESAISGSRPLEPACSRFSHITSQATITPTNLVFHIHFTAIVIGSHKNSAAALALALATALAVGLPDYEPLYSSSTRSHPFSAPRADCRR